MSKFFTELSNALNKNPRIIGFDDFIDSIEDVMSDFQPPYPPHNIVQLDNEDNTGYLIEVALAGFDRDEIHIEEEKGYLTVSSKSPDDTKLPIHKYIHKGISKRDFKLKFRLADHVFVKSVDMDNGLLKITLEQIIPEEDKPKTYSIGYRS